MDERMYGINQRGGGPSICNTLTGSGSGEGPDELDRTPGTGFRADWEVRRKSGYLLKVR